jgi:hypothetical protein
LHKSGYIKVIIKNLFLCRGEGESDKAAGTHKSIAPHWLILLSILLYICSPSGETICLELYPIAAIAFPETLADLPTAYALVFPDRLHLTWEGNLITILGAKT